MKILWQPLGVERTVRRVIERGVLLVFTIPHHYHIALLDLRVIFDFSYKNERSTRAAVIGTKLESGRDFLVDLPPHAADCAALFIQDRYSTMQAFAARACIKVKIEGALVAAVWRYGDRDRNRPSA